MNVRVRAVIFDFNGVLVDDEHVHFELFRDVLAAEGIELTERAYHAEYLGFDDRGAFEAALQGSGRSFDRAKIEDLIARKAKLYVEVAEAGLKLFPGAAESVLLAAERGPVAICSGALRAEVEFGLRKLAVRELVSAIVASEDTTRCKPDPEGYVSTLKALQTRRPDLTASECLVVEDSLAGVEAGAAAGMFVVGVCHTYQHDELLQAGARVVLPTLAAFPSWANFSDMGG